MRLFSFLFLFFVLLFGCRGPRYAANNLMPGSIPPDITNPKYVLLVQQDEHSRPKLLDKAMKKYYPSSYEIVTANQVKSDTKYGDVEKYRYLVVVRYGSGGIITQTSGPGPSRVAYSDQIVFDRKENKEYPATNLMGHNQAQGMMLFSQAITRKK